MGWGGWVYTREFVCVRVGQSDTGNLAETIAVYFSRRYIADLKSFVLDI